MVKKNEITEELLNDLTWKDFSYLPNEKVFVLLYGDPNKGIEFLKLLHSNEFDFRLLKEDGTDRHIIEMEFLPSHYVVRWVSTKTEQAYPLRARIAQNGVNYLSTGINNPDVKGGVLFNQKVKQIDLKLGGHLNN